MSNALAVVNCAQVVTLAGPPRPRIAAELSELEIIEDGAMLVRGGQVEKVGSRREIESLVDKDTEVVDAERRIILPGFVDAHAHPVFAGTRANEFEERASGSTYQEIAARGGGIQSTVRATREATKSGYGLTVEDELKILLAIRRLNDETPLNFVPTFLGAQDVPPEYRSRRDQYVSLLIEEMIPRVAQEKLAEYCDVFCEEKVFTSDESWKILSAARCHGLGLRMHADQLSLSGGAKLAAELNTVTADHLEHTDAGGIAALKSARVQPVLLPGSVYALGSSRYPAAREMIEAGLAVVLATDFNPGSSPTPSMLMILSLASTHMRMSPAESITAATINAAYSLNRGGAIGSLEAGKRADFVIHDCADYRELAYFFGIEHPWRVYAEGRLILTRNQSATDERR